METEVIVEVRAVVAWRIEDGKPVVDGVRIVGCDTEDARRALAEQLRPDGETMH